MMSNLLQAFVLGNSAIFTNACMLPLYPGTIAFLSSQAGEKGSKRISIWLGFLVLAGILSAMLVLGFVLFAIGQSLGGTLLYLLPAIYGIVIVLGIMMWLDRNPFAKLMLPQAPEAKNPLGTAYLYGLMFGPMTLPCTGPVITAAFVLSADSSGGLSIAALLPRLLYFLAFGLGFGWPLLALPMLAHSAQRRFVTWMARHHTLLQRLSGTLLVVIGLFGLWTEWLPNLR